MAPVTSESPPGHVGFAGGAGQVCAAKKSGDVLCWGTNTSDQAGQAAPSFARSPVNVLLPKD